ncbi:YdcF family protein [Cupriavidus sp. 30B13]|uniref:YdcF family protein n=1 Tax=Cupriavidus sp. 30B13 TaxID=3384241 RepID=UPI003B90ABE7
MSPRPLFRQHRPQHPLRLQNRILLLLAAGLALALLLLAFAKDWLPREDVPARADWIVVLGGESGERVIGAAELYHAGVAPFVFVTGTGDCLLNVRRLVMAGVPRGRIGYECMSRSTMENARMTRAQLERFVPRRAVLVTSWYHTSRALQSFRQSWGEVEWGAHGVHPGVSLDKSLVVYEAGAVLAEYLKHAWYAVRY